MTEFPRVGFPAPLLGDEPVRLPVLYQNGSLIAVMKPAGVLVQVDPWYPKLPVLVEAIRYQAMHEKPEFLRMGISSEGLWAITDLDPECAGPVLFSSDREKAEEMKNQFGSDAFLMEYEFLSTAGPTKGSAECELPLARHRHRPAMLVSHTTGKKCRTEFALNTLVGNYTLWTAKTSFSRRHQIPLHAAESGIPILGDRNYGRSSPLLLSKLKKDYRPRGDREERPLFGGPACYLRALKLPDGTVVNGPAPPRWSSSIRQLIKYSVPG
jgi:23S rRNA-/tRNA-specific pseudouridylate synthase